MDKKAVKRFGVQMMLVLVLIILVQVPVQADDNPFFSLVSPNLFPSFPPFPLPSPNYIPAAPRHDATGAEAIAQKECREECADKLHPCDIEKLGALKFWLEKCIEDCLKPYAKWFDNKSTGKCSAQKGRKMRFPIPKLRKIRI